MSEKWSPTEAQRKAMEEVVWGELDFQSMSKVERVVDRAIHAANSIPEGAPVGTGALRPDGAFVAIRVAGPYWTYVNVNQDDDAVWPEPDAADSWPVIYDPTVEAGKERLRKILTQPSVFEDPDRPGWTVCEWHAKHPCGCTIQDPWAVQAKCVWAETGDPAAQGAES